MSDAQDLCQIGAKGDDLGFIIGLINVWRNIAL